MRFSRDLLVLVASLPLAFAYPKITVPAGGALIPGGTAFSVTWVDSGDAPSIADLTTFTMFLFSGSNTTPQQLYSVAPSTSFTLGSTISVTVPTTVGGTGTNAYFIGMQSVATAGGTIWTYSSRFTLTGMTGSGNTAAVVGTAGPPVQNNIVSAAPAAGTSAVADGVFGTPYTLQTGLTKYAPMQPMPGTAITATNTAPLQATSSVVIATTFLPIPSIVTTITQGNTFSTASHANTAAAASSPVDAMQRFLNRWKD